MPTRTPRPGEIAHIERSVIPLRQPARNVLRKLQEAAATRPWAVYVTDGPRSQANQWEKYKVGRQLEGGIWVKIGKTITNARPDLSYHCRAAAVDFGLILSGVDVNHDGYDDWLPDAHEDWNLIGKYAKEEGLEWGGDFMKTIIVKGVKTRVPNPDKPHVQLPGALSKYPLLP